MKFKSISARILVPVVLTISLSVIIFVIVISKETGSQINDQINEKMNEFLDRSTLEIRGEFLLNASVAKSLALYAELCTDEAIERDEMKNFLMKSIPLNKNTMGGGIWYEPFAYRNEQYFGPYASLNNGVVEYEADYASTVNFHEEEWYINGKGSKGEPVWSSVYFDPVPKVTMITSTVPFFDSAGKMKGVATTDMDLSDVQNIAKEMTVGKTGKAFILGPGGEYVAFYDDSRKLEDKITGEKDGMADFGRRALSSKEGVEVVNTSGKMSRIFYKTIPETGWIMVIMIDEDEISSNIRNLILASAAAPIAGLIIVALLIFFTVAYIRRVARKINNFALRAAEGDISGRIDITEHDEFGTLEEHLNKMMENMSSMYAGSIQMNEKIVAAAEKFTLLALRTKESVDQLSINVNEVGDNLTMLASAVEAANASVEEVTAGIQTTAGSGTNIAVQVDEAMKAGKNGMESVVKAVAGIEEVATDASTAAKSVRELGEKAQQIQNFVAEIGGIADQTNLLALNAAIEAARAGESGRGFAVVAEEVRKLAEDSNVAAKNIASLAGTITNDLVNVVGMSQRNAEASQEAKALSVKTKDLIGNMISILGRIAESTQSLAVVSKEQAGSSEEIAREVQDITTKVADTAKASENIRFGVSGVSSDAETMTRGAEDLALLANNMEKSLERIGIKNRD
ncbi:MAG: methyl-accepting chemotaxis protein [Synergistaceae bacterium]|nr:methyl-accepting chemotaxis protein [Synergistaceae bacterium]